MCPFPLSPLPPLSDYDGAAVLRDQLGVGSSSPPPLACPTLGFSNGGILQLGINTSIAHCSLPPRSPFDGCLVGVPKMQNESLVDVTGGVVAVGCSLQLVRCGLAENPPWYFSSVKPGGFPPCWPVVGPPLVLLLS
jgi:hypothetical protein